jgi:hypothetical protein
MNLLLRTGQKKHAPRAKVRASPHRDEAADTFRAFMRVLERLRPATRGGAPVAAHALREKP